MTSRPKRILYVHHGGDWIRGSERALLDLLRYLDRSRFSPIVWTNSSGLASESESLECDVHHMPFRYVLDERSGAARAVFTQIREAYKYVREGEVDLIHVSSGAPVQWLLPAARIRRVPLLVHLHTPYDRRHRCGFLLHQAQIALGSAEPAVAGLREDGISPERTPIVHYGIDPDRVLEGSARGLRGELGISDSHIVVTFVGSMIHRKGVDVLLEAAMHLRERVPELRILLVGDGPDQPWFESMAEALGLMDTVTFLGERPQAGAIFRDATDIAVLPSREELFGLVNLEAALAGVPVVASAVDGIPEAVAHGTTGILVPPENPAALAGALADLAGDVEWRKRLGAAGRERVLDGFTSARMAAGIQAVYEDLLADVPWGWWAPWQGGPAYRALIGGVVGRRIRSLLKIGPPSPRA